MKINVLLKSVQIKGKISEIQLFVFNYLRYKLFLEQQYTHCVFSEFFKPLYMRES